MTSFYCPFKILGEGTKCDHGRPFREFEIMNRDEYCMAWDDWRCTLCIPLVEVIKRE